MKKRTIRKVAVVMDLEYASSRDILPGISDYVRGRCLWHIKVFAQPGEIRADDLERQFDGMILNERTAIRFARRITHTDTPIVVLGNAEDFPFKPRRNIVFVHNDNRAIGRLGAQHLAALGKFRSFGYVPPATDCHWSRQRLDGFREHLSERSVSVRTPGRMPLADFIAALPKPTAVMAAYDVRASEIVSICNDLDIRIPRQLSIVGVDNDEMLCCLSEPSLSSIMPDHRRKGYLAAQALDRLLRAKHSHLGPNVICSNLKLIVRESTTPIPTSTYVVDKALEFIRANALRNLTVDDVIAHLGISKPLAYLRFREAKAGTIADAILKARLGEVARRLRASHTAVSDIAAQCSFANVQHLANAFKRRYGVTMTAYRALPSTSDRPPR